MKLFFIFLLVSTCIFNSFSMGKEQKFHNFPMKKGQGSNEPPLFFISNEQYPCPYSNCIFFSTNKCELTQHINESHPDYGNIITATVAPIQEEQFALSITCPIKNCNALFLLQEHLNTHILSHQLRDLFDSNSQNDINLLVQILYSKQN